MASSGDEGLPARQLRELGSDSESGDSESGGSNRFSGVICQWRNERFNEQECSRYFDCPSHMIERAASDSSDDVNYDSSGAEHDHDSGSDRDNEVIASSSNTNHEDILPIGNSPREDVTSAHPLLPAPAPAPAAASSPQMPSPHATSQPLGAASGTAGNPVVLADSPPSLPSPLPGRGITENNPVVIEDDTVDTREGATSASSVQGSATSRGGATPTPSTPGSAHSTGSRSFVLPRWQPDAEVTYCPICDTQFSIFIRKHHCRKCGRVVCNSCSPHRITIPHQYIVRPVGTPAHWSTASPAGREGEHAVFNSLGGGESVRLCNPCVPDPNINPPQTQNSLAQRTHGRSQSGANQRYPGNSVPSSPWSSYAGAAPATDAYARGRSVTLANNTASSSATRPSNLFLSSSAQNRILAGTPPPYYTSPSAAAQRAYHEQNRPPLLNFGGPGPSSSASRVNRRLPPIPQPRPQIAEEDECPVCHRELPERTLPNFEALREAHITICIATHSGYGGTPPTAAGLGSGDAASPPLPPPPPRRTGLFPYVATEKDCVDSAECTICLEEFEVGVPMARLECLCRFHRRCIAAWWQRHPGRCPMHQHDSLGY